MKVTLLDLDGTPHTFRDVADVSWTNHESYGPGKPVTPGRLSDDFELEDNTLVINVNAYLAAQFFPASE